ncbi:Protein THYLAKOID FORMATION1 [Musa troglodytarum]|uniref:Protein THYLAKOID FORMATION1 n=1 Tax=Musa troglodytarum TaxID=320322 RepID=A0A9E7L258_9LILI|nr:Protein THYLAKOID FORMATION1 [Musa troglodytarum]
MASIPSVSFASPCRQATERRPTLAVTGASFALGGFRAGVPRLSSRMVVRCVAAASYVPPTISETKFNFLKSYKRPIPSIYNTVLQELLVQQHLMRYKRTYRYDAVFALGFVTVYEQLMEGYPDSEDRDAIFNAYIQALKEDPDQYRSDARKLEEWARAQTDASLVEFSSREGEIEGTLKDISERVEGKGSFSYSRFFAIGLFRLLELANATEPAALEKSEIDLVLLCVIATAATAVRLLILGGGESGKPASSHLCAALKINKRSVDRDLDVYRNILSKLVQAKELLKEYVDRAGVYQLIDEGLKQPCYLCHSLDNATTKKESTQLSPHQ